MMKTGNIFENVPWSLDEEQALDLAGAGSTRVQRILSTGHTTGWIDPDDDEWVIVLQGRGVLRFADGDRVLSMGPGDWCHIPSGCRHRVEETAPDEPTIWIAVHFSAAALVNV